MQEEQESGHSTDHPKGKRAARRDEFDYEAKAPCAGSPATRTYFVRGSRLRFLAQRGVGALREADETVRAVLRNPSSIHGGIRRDEDESPDGDGWLCYCGRPEIRFEHATGRSYNAEQDRVFLVFVTKEGVVYHWRWEPANAITGALPNAAQRFHHQVFP